MPIRPDNEALHPTPPASLAFHAEHQAQEGKFDFDGDQIVGNITSRNALGLIRQWAQLNRAALEANWLKIQSGQPLDRIPPLE